MVSNKLVVAAFAVLASVANASPCKPSSTEAVTVSATETTSAGFTSKTETVSSTTVETSASVANSDTTTEIETTAKASETTTDAISSTEASTTVSEGAATTTAVEGPLITNTGFDDGTTAPWELITEQGDTLALGSAFQGSASGKVEFGIKNGQQYSGLILQKINKKALKPGSYLLEGWTRVDYFSTDGDGCSSIITACIRGSMGNFIPIRDSIVRESAESSADDWHQTAVTCRITEEMLADDLPINVLFGFYCANSNAFLDSVEFKPIEGTETTAASNSETTTFIASSETAAVTTTEPTTMATTTEGSTTVAEAATTTTTADAGPTPLLANANFDLGTTEPWLSSNDGSLFAPVMLRSDQPYQGPAYGELYFYNDNGESFSNSIYQKVDTQLLKASSYRLTGFVRVDLASNDIYSDGCNSMGVLCTLGDPNNLNRVPGSVKSVSAESAAGDWASLETTCTFTEQMLSQYDYITVSFGFNCLNSATDLDAVTFEEVV
ncbi:hypothetical protein FSPOR_5606 [Fusarium sporotrichioides]|uniref:CBM-cenC domain-containing protein n=1 Tax=Fusarium sporotrichioides TaxID=5514 RepID=A0A395S6S9_FUSSP|nr:hypothetical protein FSPOR_5606 [Fusarium sporotrichioides]